MFNGIPELFDDKIQNYELYIQKRFYDQLQLLNYAPIIQNPTGLFTNYINGEVETGDVEYTNNGIDFNEIKFGAGRTEHGQTLPMGFMYRADKRLARKGKYEATLQSFFNGAVTKLADFYEETYMNSLLNGGRVNTAELETEDSAEAIMNNELTLMDEMSYDTKDNRTGFNANLCFVNRKDRLNIEKELAKEKMNANFMYISTNKIPEGTKVILDSFNPAFTIEKFAEPEYSTIARLEEEEISVNDYNMPTSFINIKVVDTNRPNNEEYYLWAESNLNILNSNGILIVQ